MVKRSLPQPLDVIECQGSCGMSASGIFGDWVNRAEFTADRAGFLACRSLTSAVSAMLKFGVGVSLFQKLDIREFLEQIKDVRTVGGRVTEIIAEQPYLTERVRHLARFALSDQFREILPEERARTLTNALVSSMPTLLQPVPRTPFKARMKAWFSWLEPRISRHCTSGRPASIMTENWRKKIAMSLVLTFDDPNSGRANSFPFSRMVGAPICSRRN